MKNPKININLKKLIANTKEVVNLAAEEGIEVVGVTKSVCANLEVAKALLKGGVVGLADSRINNLAYLRENLKLDQVPLMLLRIPMLSEIEQVVKYADVSLNSELGIIRALDEFAKEYEVIHEIILMVDVGDRREGVMPDDVMQVVEEVLQLDNIKLIGLGTNLACFGGVLPSDENMKVLVELKERINNELDQKLKIISGGNSSSLPRLKERGLPPEVNQLRVGETILLGRNVINREPFPNTFQDTFLLEAEIIELKEKPAQPKGKIGQNAFGEEEIITKSGVRKRGILAVGRQDIVLKGLAPVARGVKIESASSDHLIVDLTDYRKNITVGDSLKFELNYAALLRAMTSPYVNIDII
ncbi:alanine/ornithine racemase family PLP-dependent enzyme [Natroniella sulfidigena]|uniref:alanine/ornithine racemase family PLP-dependent enzyme n=1 Tax=Natroniella sulfidigena TaxID=723921 RepID=UPI00200AAB15|nr:alanine/ornithine racemase family PLP-dependent enzyme [Natroniella sulfidigena]